jgi:hypothetical protein
MSVPRLCYPIIELRCGRPGVCHEQMVHAASKVEVVVFGAFIVCRPELCAIANRALSLSAWGARVDRIKIVR